MNKLEEEVKAAEAALKLVKHKLKSYKDNFQLKAGFVFYTKGSVSERVVSLTGSYVENGAARATYELAILAAKNMTIRNRLEAFAMQIDGNEVVNWDKPDAQKYCISYNVKSKKYLINARTYLQDIGTVYMSKKAATILKDALNQGIIVL